MMLQYFELFIKNGFYIHFITAWLYYITHNPYIAWIVSFKLYSTNYFYWYGHLYSYLPNPKYNWIKQCIRFTDTGHIASILPHFYKPALPLCHNVHFVITAGYWIGKLGFGMPDSDRLENSESNSIIEWHVDLCTYIHHIVPYVLVYSLWKNELEMDNKKMVCNEQYQYNTLIYTYDWIYVWFFMIYLPWTLYTKDCVYSVLDPNQTHTKHIVFFILFIHFLVYVGNKFAFIDCIFYQAEPQLSMYEL